MGRSINKEGRHKAENAHVSHIRSVVAKPIGGNKLGDIAQRFLQ